MRKEIIVFDKDGTLIDFDAFWVNVSISAVKEVLKYIGIEADITKILNAFGVENGVTDIDGILCKGTYAELGLALYDGLKEYGCENLPEEIIDLLNDAYKKSSDCGEIKPTCDNIKEVLGKLKDEGRTLIVVTTDNFEITNKCLDELGIRGFFDAIFADDGITPTKPNPACILDYCKEKGINIDNAIMVGDTMTDIKFARNAGMNVIGVGTTEKNRQRLMPYADFVMKDISSIHDVIREYEK